MSSTRSRARRAPPLVALGFLLRAAASSAQPAPDAAVERARAAFDEGVACARDGRWAEALAAFQRSRAAADRARTAFNEALALRALGRFREALRAADGAAGLPGAAADLALQRDLAGLRESLRASLATLTLTASPPDANVTVDGERAPDGASRPLALDPGARRLLVSAPGHAPYDAPVELARGEARALTVTLAPLPARLAVRPAPPGAAVHVDGRDVRDGRWEGAAGPHVVEVQAVGHVSLRRDVTLRPGELRAIDVALAPERRSAVRSPWFWVAVAGGAALVAGAVLTAVLVPVPGEPAGGSTGRVGQAFAFDGL